MSLRLITIGFSHYCEKARWGLDRAKLSYVEQSHAPLLHVPVTRRYGARTVPILVDLASRETFRDSTDILREIDRRCPEAGLFPSDPALRAECLAIEDDLDETLGPAARRAGYFFLLHRGGARFGREMLAGSASPATRNLVSLAYPAIAWAIGRGLKVDEKGFERSMAKLDEVFVRIDARLEAARAEGRRYLVGDSFSVADLTLAALSAPLLAPRKTGWPTPPRDLLPPDLCALADKLARTPSGAHALRMYETERNVP